MAATRRAARICISGFSLAAACEIGAALCIALLPTGSCLAVVGRVPQAQIDTMWALLALAFVSGLTALVALPYAEIETSSRLGRRLTVTVLLEIVGLIALLAFFLHQGAHWYDCG